MGVRWEHLHCRVHCRVHCAMRATTHLAPATLGVVAWRGVRRLCGPLRASPARRTGAGTGTEGIGTRNEAKQRADPIARSHDQQLIQL